MSPYCISKHGTTIRLVHSASALVGALAIAVATGVSDEPGPRDDSLVRGLIGHWRLNGDSRDSSSGDNHAVNHGVRLRDGAFDGSSAYLEIPSRESLRIGTSDFAISVWVRTESGGDDAIGDILELYDPAIRRGITLAVNSSAGGYQSQCADRHVYFGIDNAKLSDWQDCGRPSPTSPYVNNSMIVFQGHLYCGTSEGAGEKDWCHVYRYDRDQSWVDCGRVGDQRTTGVGPLFVHDGKLHAVTTTYDWTRVQTDPFDAARVYRYAGGTNWEDLGKPSENRTLNSAASFQGQIFVGGGPKAWGVYVRRDDGTWAPSKLFPMKGPGRCFPHPMTRFNGKLYVGWPGIYSFDGEQWLFAGSPAEPESQLQTHSFCIFRGQLVAGTWPRGKVARYLDGAEWEVLGQVGEDGTEVNSLLVYNGKLYAGSLPRAEVCRYDEQPQWTSLRRFYSPEGWTPVPPADNGGRPTRAQVAEWSRVTSMTIYRGRLFASTGNCTSSIQDTPADIRGTVHSLQAGVCVSHDEELEPGWRHLVATRDDGRLKLHIDGRLVAESDRFESSEFDLSVDRPLKIGFGQIDHFRGQMADVRFYRRALTSAEIRSLANARPDRAPVR